MFTVSMHHIIDKLVWLKSLCSNLLVVPYAQPEKILIIHFIHLTDQNTAAFKEVAIISHPRAGEYAFGFITSSMILQVCLCKSLYTDGLFIQMDWRHQPNLNASFKIIYSFICFREYWFDNFHKLHKDSHHTCVCSFSVLPHSWNSSLSGKCHPLVVIFDI